MIIKLNKQLGEKIVFIALCLTPFLGIYENSIVLVITVLPLVIFVLMRLFNRTKLRADYLMGLIGWSLLGTVLYCLSDSTTRNNVFILYITIFTLEFLDYKELRFSFINIYKFFAWFSVAFLFCQVLAFYLLGYNLTFTIPFLDVTDSMRESFRYLSYYSRNTIGVRFFGSLYEPAAYSEYVIPLLMLTLFDKSISNRKKTIFSLIISISIVLTISSIGLILTIFAWLLYFCFYGEIRRRRLILAPIGIVLLITTDIYIYNHSPVIHNQIYRVLSNDPTKTGYRLFRGFSYYFQSPIINKIIGVGYMNGVRWAKMHGISSIYDSINMVSAEVEYFNGISQTFLYFGIGGFLFVLCYYISNFKKASRVGRVMWIMYFLLIIGSSHLFRGMGAIYLMLCMMFERGYDDDSHFDNSLWC